MHDHTHARKESTEQHRNHSLLDQPGYWRAFYTDTHPDDCQHRKDARILYGKTDVTGNPVLEELCRECGLKTDKTLDGVSRGISL